MVRHPSVVFCRRRSQCSNIFFSETAGPIKATLYLKPPWIGGTKFFSWHLDRMPKMAATPMYGRFHSKILCIYIYICIYIHIYICVCVCVCVCACMYVCMYEYVLEPMSAYVLMFA